MTRIFRSTFVLAAAVLATSLASGAASAQQKEAFTPERFAQLQQQDALILIDIFADWCPTCAQQQKILADFQAKHPDSPLHILQVDFDRQKEWVTHFRAPRQSTLILYQGKDQVWFSIAETRPEVVLAELTKAGAAATCR